MPSPVHLAPAGSGPVLLPAGNISRAGHRCHPKSTLFNPEGNTSFLPSSVPTAVSRSWLCWEKRPNIQPRKPPMQRNILSSDLVSGPDNPGDEATNQHALLPSWNFKLNSLEIVWNLHSSKCSSSSSKFGEGKVWGQQDAVPVKWGVLDHAASCMGPSRPCRTSRLPPAVPCFHSPHQIFLARQAAHVALPARNIFYFWPSFPPGARGQSSLEPAQVHAPFSRHYFLTAPIKATPSLLPW